jgi:membrane protein
VGVMVVRPGDAARLRAVMVVRSTGAGSWNPRERLLRAKDRSPASLVRLSVKLTREFQRLEPFDRAMTLAAQAFTSIFPLVIATLSFLDRPDAGRLSQQLADTFGLPSSTRSTLADALPEGSDQAATFGLLGLLIVLVSATSFSRALTRMYAKAWSVASPGWSQPLRWIGAVTAIAASAVLLRALQRAGEGSDAGMAGALLLTFLVNCLVWTWVPLVLLARKIRWPLLAPGGVLMGIVTVASFFASRIYMPHALEYAAEKFGDLGVAFTYIGWLFAVAFALIVATILGVVLAREPGPVSRFLASRPSGSVSATASPDRMSSGTSDAPRAQRGKPESEQ